MNTNLQCDAMTIEEKLKAIEALWAFVEKQVASRGYASSDEYVRELIRRDQDLQRLRGLLLEGAESGPGEPVDFDALRARIRA